MQDTEKFRNPRIGLCELMRDPISEHNSLLVVMCDKSQQIIRQFLQ